MELRMNFDSLQTATLNACIGLGLGNVLAWALVWHVPTWLLAGIGTIVFGAISTLVNLWIKDNYERIFKAFGIDLAARKRRKLAQRKKPLGLE